MYIQYVGFNVASSSRIYNFGVIDTAEAREFTVKVDSQGFRPAALKLQDGPGICFSRLKQKLQGETLGARAEAHLSIANRDIQEYLERYYPRQSVGKKKLLTGDGGAERAAPTGRKNAGRTSGRHGRRDVLEEAGRGACGEGYLRRFVPGHNGSEKAIVRCEDHIASKR